MHACPPPAAAASRSSARRALIAGAFVAILGPVAMSGCYERVVGTKGIGSSGVDVHKPNAPGARPTYSERVTTPIER